MHRQHFSPHIFFSGSSLSPEAAVKVSAQYALIQPQLIRRRHPFTTPVTTCGLLLSRGKSLCQALSSWEKDLAIFIDQPGSTLSICCLVAKSCQTFFVTPWNIFLINLFFIKIFIRKMNDPYDSHHLIN